MSLKEMKTDNNSKKGKKRIEYIDIAKGICIIMLLLQHAHTYYKEVEILEFYAVSFRVPLFFILSGCFFSMYSGFKEFCVKKINTLLIPFFFFYFLFSVGLPNILHIVGYDGIRQASSLGWGSLFNFWTGTAHSYSNNPVWFLISLFWLSILFYVIRHFCLKTRYPMFLTFGFSLLCGFLGVTLGVYGIHTPMHTDNALTACPYFFLGFWLKNCVNVLNRKVRRLYLIIPIVLCLVVVYVLSPGIDFLGNYFPYDKAIQAYICGVSGSVAIIGISYIIRHNKILCFYGINTLVILCMQMPVLQPINIVVKRLGFNDVYSLALLTITALLVMNIVIYVYNRFLPWAIGKRAIIKWNGIN